MAKKVKKGLQKGQALMKKAVTLQKTGGKVKSSKTGKMVYKLKIQSCLKKVARSAK